MNEIFLTDDEKEILYNLTENIFRSVELELDEQLTKAMYSLGCNKIRDILCDIDLNEKVFRNKIFLALVKAYKEQ